MMKRFFIAALALAATLPAAINVQAQDDDDIYFSKKANKKAAKEALYAATEADNWQTDANDDWNLDDYNRRGKEITIQNDIPVISDGSGTEEPAFYYEIPDGNGGTTKVAGNKKVLKGADANKYKIINDTVVLVEQYYYSDLIRRFHNPYFGYYRYSPWYDVAYYDPFYWDFCFYDPWWYVTPSFGFHWGNWYGGWSYGYYTGWYGGWYSPYYHPCPHYYGYYSGPYYYGGGPVYNYATGSSHRGSSRNNFGGHFAHRGGWKGDGGVSRQISASSNRSYRAANGARTTRTNGNPNVTAGPTLRGRNAINGRIANSNMRSSTRRDEVARDYNSMIAGGGTARNNSSTRRASSYSSRGNNSSRSYNNSDNRRADAGMYQRDNGSTRSSASAYGSHSASRYNENRSSSSYNTRSSSSYNNSSSYSSSRSSGSYSSGSSYSGGGGGYSGGGGGGHSSGGSHSSGSHAGRR